MYLRATINDLFTLQNIVLYFVEVPLPWPWTSVNLYRPAKFSSFPVFII